MAKLLTRCFFSVVPDGLFEADESVLGPLNEQEMKLLAALEKAACQLFGIFAWTAVNVLLTALSEKLHAMALIQLLVTLALFMQAVVLRKIARSRLGGERLFSLHDLREQSAFLNVLVIFKAGALFSSLSTTAIHCEHPELLTVVNGIVCHPLFKVQATIAVLSYIIITMVQLEILYRLQMNQQLGRMMRMMGELTGKKLPEASSPSKVASVDLAPPPQPPKPSRAYLESARVAQGYQALSG